jgi:Pregnancy-associated plasma protein-A
VRHIALKHPIAAALKSAKAASYLALGSTACAFLLPAAAPAEVAMGRSTSFSVCDPLGTPSLLTNSVAATGVVAGRGGSVREPDLGQAHDDLPASAKGQADPGLSTTVPVYVHVVSDGRIGALTDSEISAQLRVVNQTFAGAEGGATTGFSFQLAGVTRTDNADWFYAGPGGVDENSMKTALRQGGPNALNLYSTTAGAYLGWAYLPEIVNKPGQTHLDGIVIDWESMPRTSKTYAGQFDEGKTATHEVGHWLDLEHTFYRGCSAGGDYVADTPPEKTPTSGCPAGKDTCSAPGLDPIHNYMDYSFDSCYTEFTPGQVQRMRDAWLHYRAPA